MKGMVVYPRACSKSAQELAKGLGWASVQGADYVPRGYDLYFNYGCGWNWNSFPLTRDKLINPVSAIKISTNKILSYRRFQEKKIPTCAFVEVQREIPKNWKWVVCRETVVGRNCEGVTITEQENIVPDCPLYTKFFDHDEEHRIVVFKDKVVGRYMKRNLKGGEYDLVLMDPRGYETIDPAAVAAAAAVGLDYAGVDVLFNSRTGKFLVLEINSGPALTEEALEFFINSFKGK